MKIIDSFSFHFKWADVHEYLFSLRAFFLEGKKVFNRCFDFTAQSRELVLHIK